MTLEQQWLEYDFNPFILFSQSGKILSVNSEAQFLLGCVSQQELFELATNYASVNYGFKTTFLDLEFGRYKFFGITVGYMDDEAIGIKLYRYATLTQSKIEKPQGKPTNLYTILDLCISSNSIGNDVEFLKDYDPSIPEIVIDAAKLIKTLNVIYKCFLQNKKVKTKLYYKVGETLRYERKKYPLCSIEISGAQIDQEALKTLKEINEQNNFYLTYKKDSISISLPIITE